MKATPVQDILAYFLALTLSLHSLPLQALAFEESTENTSVSETSLPPESIPEEPLPEPSVPQEPTSEGSHSGDFTSDPSIPEEFTQETVTLKNTVPETAALDESISETFPGDESLPASSAPATSEPGASEPETPAPETFLCVETPPEVILPAAVATPAKAAGPGLYFGLLSAHSNLSEGTGSVDDLFLSAAQMPDMDFFAVTDHSDSFDNRDSADIRTDATTLSADWSTGKAAAAAVTTPSFVGLFGYEMNWPSQMKLGHISTFGTPGFQSRTQDAYCNYAGALENYYAALASVPDSVSQFNHPGTQYGSFNSFNPHRTDADRSVSLLELDFGAKNPLCYYIQALDQGWHLAPTAGQSIYNLNWADTGTRTAVHAQSLTEAGILDALRNCRAYATEDADLEISYSMDGHIMGSRLDLRHIGERADISVSIHDPTDGTACTVEVITTGGQIAAEQALTGSSGILSVSLPPVSGYYFLQITQPDGDRAVSAPIWLDVQEDLGITALSCGTPVPTQQEPVNLTATFHNGETVDFLVDSLEILADGIAVRSDQSLSRIPASTTLSHPMTVTFDSIGATTVTLRLSGTLEGSHRSFETSLDISLRQQEQISDIAIGNGQPVSLEILNSLASKEHIRFQTGMDISSGSLQNCRFLLVTAPSQPFSADFLDAAKVYVASGGSIVLCAQEDYTAGNWELNRLLCAIGSTLRITDQLVQDSENNSGDPARINTDRINRSLSWCEGISENQVYRADFACAVDPGQGQWMVKAEATAGSGEDVLLACEDLSGGGTVFAAGSLFLDDENLAAPENLWEEPCANRTIAQNLLGIGGEAIPQSTIAQVRAGRDGQLFRIQGYVTVGISNPHNCFQDTLYLQDDTGGIAVVPFSAENIQPGTPVEIIGYAGTSEGSPVLKLSSWKVLEGNLYQYPPLEGDWVTLLDIAQNGSRLVQVEGVCREIYCREDNTLSGCLLDDEHGNSAVIQVEDHIGNSSDGKNELHLTIRNYRTVRAVGLLHTDAYGNTVIRVRSCDEVVWVPPRYYWNPRTGDFLLPGACTAMTVSALGLALLRKRKVH